MACQGSVGDYLCDGWRQRAEQIRRRDGDQCRGCNRSSEEVRLEVHHRRYGKHGGCGECVLTGVTDEDLVTLCGGPGGCHEAITNVRRALRYADREVVHAELAAPSVARVVVRARLEVVTEHTPEPPARTAPPRRRYWQDL